MLEAARRATWDALNGPRYLRSGCFNPSINFPKSIEETPIEDTTEGEVTATFWFVKPRACHQSNFLTEVD